jgi:hypothetical protein
LFGIDERAMTTDVAPGLPDRVRFSHEFSRRNQNERTHFGLVARLQELPLLSSLPILNEFIGCAPNERK